MIRRNVMWIASYPKSGNTWVHSVLRSAGHESDFPQTDMDVYNIARNGKELLTCGAVNPKFAPTPCVVLKTHSPFRETMHYIPGYELVNAAYIHVYRNPLDVLLSYINFSRLDYARQPDNPAVRKRLFLDLLGFDRPYEYSDWLKTSLDMIPRKNLDHALDYFSDNGLILDEMAELAGSWLENTTSWVQAASILPGRSIRYEDCLADPETITRLAEMFTFGEDKVLEMLDFENSKVRIEHADPYEHDAVFFNKMSAYYFVDYFSRPAIERFMARYGGALRMLGYEDLLRLV